ncbi:DUF4270 domain-containing protein [Flavobacterium caeni]|uniref:DUF4270 domain-containing protein n=1 Tax=Flavobacterium caeni TaxID=490189 RepID=UPI00147B250E|nr:DUF4270 domain-containing protein [Flavobacterium caeni]
MACDTDANEMGANIVGDDNFAFGDPEDFDFLAYNQALGPVETSNLAVQQLGVYNDPVFGKTTAHIVVQALMSVQPTNISYARVPVVDKVVLNIPYFSTLTYTDPDAETANTYELDSVYNKASKINLQVYESLFYQRAVDPETGETQKYYSDQIAAFEGAVGSTLLNDSELPEQNTEFIFTELGGFSEDEEGNKTKVGPSMNLLLNKDFFANKIMAEAASGNLVNNNVFVNYFRGLHFKVSQSGSDAGALALLDISKGTIKIHYHQYVSDPTPENPTPDTEDKIITLNLSGKSVNLKQHENTGTFENALNNAAPATGDAQLFVKGGQSMAVIELFKTKAELDALRQSVRNNWLINDASLTFYVDRDAMGSATDEPNRIYLYDINNKVPLIDYSTDQLTSFASVKYNKRSHGGIIVKEDGRGTLYKVRITNHIRKLMTNDTITNVKLGLVVTENINVTSNKSVKTPILLPQIDTFASFLLKDTPQMNIANPFGTILWGNTPGVPDDKKMKFTIYFTKPN